MRRVAAHRLYLPDGKTIHLPVVEIEDTYVVNYYPMPEELPVTEWLGGIFFLSSATQVATLSSGDSLAVILKKVGCDGDVPMSYPLHLWYLEKFDITANTASFRPHLSLLTSTEDDIL